MATNNQVNTPISTVPVGLEIAAWDANKNHSANAYINGYATTATAAATTTLTVASAWQQFFTGSTTQTVVLPVTSTLVLGQSFYIVNNSTGVVTVQSSGANTVQAMAGSTTLLVTCINTGVTTAAGWSIEYVGAASGGTVNSGTAGQVAYYATSTNAVSGGTLQNIAGVKTNSSSSTGNIGEFVSSVISSASAVSMTVNVPNTVTSISLTAGDWDVWGNINAIGTGLNLPSITTWISSSTSLPDSSLYDNNTQYSATITGNIGCRPPSLRFPLSGTTTIYLQLQWGAAAGSLTACGGIYARRRT